MLEVLIYGLIGAFSAEEFIKAINEDSDAEELTVRVNTDGGDPQMAFGMAAKFNEFAGKKTVKVDGKAYSSGLFFLAYADNVEALDVSEFLVHRAAYPSWIESSPEFFTDELRANLESVNKSLRAAFEAKVDVKLFEQMKGVKTKDIFSLDSRIDVFLTAKEAKKIGLVNKINKLTPAKAKKINAFCEDFKMAAQFEVEAEKETEQNIENSSKNKDMKLTLEALKTDSPELFAEVLGMGVAQEKDRVGAWLAWSSVDPEAVAEGIKSGEAITTTAVQELTVKQNAAAAKAGLTTESAPTVEAEKETIENHDDQPSELESLEAKLDAELGLKA